jgi:hypothetical protein
MKSSREEVDVVLIVSGGKRKRKNYSSLPEYLNEGEAILVLAARQRVASRRPASES